MDHTGKVIAATNTFGPTVRMPPKRLKGWVKEIKHTAARISYDLRGADNECV